VSPLSASVTTGGTKQFSATGLDQNGQPMNPQPSFTWSVTGVGSIDSTGLFAAGSVPGSSTVTATSGSVHGIGSVTVTSPPPDFTLSIDPPSQSVKRGGIATYTVTITPMNGFTGSVTLSLTGQPSRAAVSFGPIVSNTSTLTIDTAANTARRSYALTIRGVSGSLSHTTTASLTVN
jgi:Bacterial Ig-like domain (group 2)